MRSREPPAPEGVVPSEVHQPPAPEVQYHQRTDDSHGYYEDPYGYKPADRLQPSAPPPVRPFVRKKTHRCGQAAFGGIHSKAAASVRTTLGGLR